MWPRIHGNIFNNVVFIDINYVFFCHVEYLFSDSSYLVKASTSLYSFYISVSPTMRAPILESCSDLFDLAEYNDDGGIILSQIYNKKGGLYFFIKTNFLYRKQLYSMYSLFSVLVEYVVGREM